MGMWGILLWHFHWTGIVLVWNIIGGKIIYIERGSTLSILTLNYLEFYYTVHSVGWKRFVH
jgi:hypothetical protein